MLAVYRSSDEVLVFAASQGVVPPETLAEYFGFGNRDLDDYDLELVDPPLVITSRIRVDSARIHV